jgi:hypothetical protein
MERLYGDLVELEGIAVTADECVTSLPVFPTDKYKAHHEAVVRARRRDRRPSQRGA